MMITYRSRFLTRGEVWFDNDSSGGRRSLDWIMYHQRSRPVPGARARYFYTFLVDLTQSCDVLLARLRKDTAYKIRRARDRDKITCEYTDPRDSGVMDRFEEMYNTFAEKKGLTRLDRPRMESLAAAGLLEIALARDPYGTVLLYHANYHDHSRAALLELPSIYRGLADSAARNLVGRANRYLTWTDILRYKEQGLKSFDFGGWYYGADPSMLKINDFKRGFGGKVAREYECEQILSVKGWLVLAVAAAMKRYGSRALRTGNPQSASEPSNTVPEVASSPRSSTRHLAASRLQHSELAN